MIILPESIDVTTRWAECFERNSVMCWRALSTLLLAYSRLETQHARFGIANDLFTLHELAKQHAVTLAPFDDVPAMNHTFRQRSTLIMEVERRERQHNRGDYIVGAVGIVGCVILILNLLGVA